MTANAGLENFLRKIQTCLPGGVECNYCHFVNTYEHVEGTYKHVGGDLYSFRQIVQCNRCGIKAGFCWEQEVKPDYGVKMVDIVQTEENENA